MKSSTIEERFTDFTANPIASTYLTVREQILVSKQYDPYSEDMRQLEWLTDQADYELVLDEVAGMLPLWCLSPRLQFLAGIAALELGDESLAGQRKSLTRKCLQGLMSTGSGDPDRPYLVTYASDEYDLLRALNVQVQSQQLVEMEAYRCDVITCQDDSEYWFDVTDLVRGPSPVTTKRATKRRHPTARQA